MPSYDGTTRSLPTRPREGSIRDNGSPAALSLCHRLSCTNRRAYNTSPTRTRQTDQNQNPKLTSPRFRFPPFTLSAPTIPSTIHATAALALRYADRSSPSTNTNSTPSPSFLRPCCPCLTTVPPNAAISSRALLIDWSLRRPRARASYETVAKRDFWVMPMGRLRRDGSRIRATPDHEAQRFVQR
jgi:hypothetical protein